MNEDAKEEHLLTGSQELTACMSFCKGMPLRLREGRVGYLLPLLADLFSHGGSSTMQRNPSWLFAAICSKYWSRDIRFWHKLCACYSDLLLKTDIHMVLTIMQMMHSSFPSGTLISQPMFQTAIATVIGATGCHTCIFGMLP